MILLKKVTSFILHYALAILIANFVVGVLTLIFKVSLLTVQGPTMVSKISVIVTYYTVLSIAFFFLFRSYGKKKTQLRLKEISLYVGLIVIMHTVIVFSAGWPTVWLITIGSLSLADFMYTGGGFISSIREIPRFYYFVALAIEDTCFVVFSLIGYYKGSHK